MCNNKSPGNTRILVCAGNRLETQEHRLEEAPLGNWIYFFGLHVNLQGSKGNQRETKGNPKGNQRETRGKPEGNQRQTRGKPDKQVNRNPLKWLVGFVVFFPFRH